MGAARHVELASGAPVSRHVAGRGGVLPPHPALPQGLRWGKLLAFTTTRAERGAAGFARPL